MRGFMIRFGIGVVIISLLVVLAGYFLIDHDKKVIPVDVPNTHINETIEEKKLPFLSPEEDPVVAAIEKKDIDYCEYVNNTIRKEACKKTVYDNRLYDQALSTFNPELCKGISNQYAKESCIVLTQSGKDYITEKDFKYLAYEYLNSHNNDDAILYFEEAINSKKEDIGVYLALSLAYAGKGLEEQEKGNSQNQYVEKAFIYVNKAKEISPNDSEVYRIEGYVYEIKPDQINAIKSYNKAIELDSGNIIAYAGRGHSYRLIGSVKNAIEDFRKAKELDVNRDNTYIYTNLCVMEGLFGNKEEAISNCEIVISSNDKDQSSKIEAYMVLADYYMKDSEFDKAENYLLNAKSLSPDDANIYATFAKLYNFKRELNKSEEMAKKAIEISPTKSFAYEMLSYSYYLQGRYLDSIKESQKGLELVDKDVSLLEESKGHKKKNFYRLIADSYEQLGDIDNMNKYTKLSEEP